MCYPAKLTHGHIESLLEQGVDFIFYPCMSYNIDEGDSDNHYNCPVVAYYPELLMANCEKLNHNNFLYPFLDLNRRSHVVKTLSTMFSRYATKKQVETALEHGFAALEQYRKDIVAEGEEIVRQARDAGKQIIVTSDRLPKDIKTLASRLLSRFEHGIIVDIQPPDLELRVAIFKRKAESLGMNVPNDVLMYLGENIKDNIRQSEGALKKMRALAFIQGIDVCMEHAKIAVADILTAKASAVTPERILTFVSQKYGIPTEDIIGKRKTDAIASARQVAIYLLRELTDMSFANIGKVFNRDHSTVVASVNKVKDRMKEDSSFEAQIDDMMKDVRSAGY